MFKTILYPIDISGAHSWAASLPVVVSQAKAYKAKVVMLTVLPDYGMSFASHLFDSGMIKKITKETQEKIKALAESSMPGIKTEACVMQGTVYECILEKAKKVKADLIIMSAQRPELKDYLLGPNAARVVRHAECSVLVVRE